MKKRLKMLKALVLIALIVLIVSIISIKQVYRYVAIKNADAIVRIGYRGLENMFHAPYEYYAIGSGPSYRVSKKMVEKCFGEDADQRDIYFNNENLYWWVSLDYSENSDFDSNNKLYLKTSFGEQYRLFYEEWTNDGNLPDASALKIIQQATEKLCGEYLNDGGDPYTGSFMFTQHGEKYLIELKRFRIILKVSEEGNITKIMEVPKKGDLDYCYFLDSDWQNCLIAYIRYRYHCEMENLIKILKKSRILKFSLLIVFIIGIRHVYRCVVTKNADAIVRIGYTGLENMLHTRYEYYAIGSGAFCSVSRGMVEKRFGKDAEKRSMYNDTENLYWWVSLRFSENSDFHDDEKLYLKTSFGEQYRLCYEDAQYDGNLPDAAALGVILQATEKLCGEYLNDGGAPYSGSFMFIQHGEKFLIELEIFHIILKVSEEGTIIKLMKVPGKGFAEYYFYLDTD